MKFSKSLEKLFCGKSRILRNHENKFLQKIYIYIYMYAYGIFKCIFSRFEVTRGVTALLRSNQTIEPPCSRTFCYNVWCYTTTSHQLKLPQQDFGNLYSIPYVKMFIHSCGHTKQWVETATIAAVSLPYEVT